MKVTNSGNESERSQGQVIDIYLNHVEAITASTFFVWGNGESYHLIRGLEYIVFCR